MDGATAGIMDKAGYSRVVSRRLSTVCDAISVLRDSMTDHERLYVARRLIASYDALMPDVSVWELLLSVLPASVSEKLATFRSSELGHRVVNDVIMDNYPGERIVKYWFARNHVDELDSTVIFEPNIGASRLDIARVNGCSYAYEVKTELDNLARLESQMSDYEKVFEYVYAVVHPRHTANVLEMLPPHCGIVQICDHCHEAQFDVIRDAVESSFLSPEAQVESLSSKDLGQLLCMIDMSPAPNTRAERQKAVLDALDDRQINTFFKELIKAKFSSRWRFVQQHFNQLLPVDMELFYRSMADPKWVYYRCSSMV